jgi:uncharacterized membrane protein YsdA (DUF1294 family)
MTPLEIGLALLATVNVATFTAFGVDKAQARARGWRISESTLLWLAFLGGSPGAYAARSHFRHKTRKQPFVGQLHAIAVLQVVAIAGAVYWLGWKA